MSPRLAEWRCNKPACRRLLMKVRLAPDSEIEVVCPKCGTKQTLEEPQARKAA